MQKLLITLYFQIWSNKLLFREESNSFHTAEASTMLGCKSEAGQLLLLVPGLTISDCLTHRLQLAMDNAIKPVLKLNISKRSL